MKNYKAVPNVSRPFMLCKQTVGRSYIWADEHRAGDRAIDLPKADAFTLAKFLELGVREFHTHLTHILGVFKSANLNEIKLGIGFRSDNLGAIVVLDSAYALDKVNGAIGGNKLFALNGFAHEKSFCCSAIAESGYMEKYLSKPKLFQLCVRLFVNEPA